MKKHNIFIAISAICFCFSACDSKTEQYATEINDITNETAELLLDCKDQDDINDAVKEINELTKKAEEISSNAKSDKLKMEEEIKQMTRRESEELEKELVKESLKAAALLEDGVYHVNKIEGAKCEEINKAIHELKKALFPLEN
ncbi:MAG: hypothetical protein IJY53_07935 [Akkermansia sp.]|nr:hypothetical protein [Akkermansia sp.]